MTMHSATHNYFTGDNFIEQNVLFEGTEHNEETPVPEACMSEIATRPQLRMLSEEVAGGFDCVKIPFGYFPTGINHLPFKLPLDIGDEIVRLADGHGMRSRTRWRMASKSSCFRSVVGLSAASRSHASNSGVASNGLCCCSRTERRISLTSSLALSQTPERTCFSRKSSTSLAKAIVTLEHYRAARRFARCE